MNEFDDSILYDTFTRIAKLKINNTGILSLEELDKNENETYPSCLELLNVNNVSYQEDVENEIYLLIENELFNDAIKLLSEQISLDKNNYLYLIDRAKLYLKINNPKHAIVDIKKSIIILSTQYAYYYLGIANKEINKLDDALNSFNKAIELENDYANAYFERGLLPNNTSWTDLSRISDLTQAIDRKCTKLSEAYYRRHEEYVSKGNRKAARSDYDKAIELAKVEKISSAKFSDYRLKKLEEDITSLKEAVLCAGKITSDKETGPQSKDAKSNPFGDWGKKTGRDK